MQTSARPLLDNSIDAQLFVGRAAETTSVLTALRAQLNVLVTGERGSGRTSFLRHLQHSTRSHPSSALDLPMTYVRVEGIDDGVELLRRTVHAVTGASSPDSDIDGLLRDLADHRDGLVEEIAEQWPAYDNDNNEIYKPPPQPVIIIDDVGATAGHEVFGRYRDEVWATRYLWIVSVRESERGGLLTPPADTFFEKVVELGPLLREEAMELFNRRGVDGSLSSAEVLVEAVSGNPRALVGALRSMIEDAGSFDANLKAIRTRDAAIEAIGRPATMLAAELKARGAVSASDESLLDALGWTRSRAAQVFKELSSHGLVISREVASGTGRPRKVFELTAPAVWLDSWENGGTTE